MDLDRLVIHQGDALTVLRTLPEESVQCCVTSPPYWGLRDYGIEGMAWGGEFTHKHEWGTEMVADAAGYKVGSKARWNHRQNGRGEEQAHMVDRAGWERLEVGQGRHCACGAWLGALGLEPTPELYVAHLVEVFRELRRVLRQDGTLWLNLGDSYASIGHKKSNSGYGTTKLAGGKPQEHHPLRREQNGAGLKHKDLIGVPWRVAFALQADGWYLRSDIIWAKPNPMPESVTDRPTKAHEYLFLLSRAERYYYDDDAIRTPLAPKTFTTFGIASTGHGDGSGLIKSENWAATVPVRKPRLATDREAAAAAGSSSTRRREGLNARWDERERVAGNGHGRLIDHVAEGRRDGQDHDTALTPLAGANARTVWTIATQPYPEAHFATFPEALVEPCILAGSRLGDTVLDPFLGSGTTLVVAKRLGREGLGIELNPAYIALAQRRLTLTTYQPDLLAVE